MKPPKNRVVLDSSALLAFLRGETGSAIVAEYIGQSVISSLNAAEIISYYVRYGSDAEETLAAVKECVRAIIPFTNDHALVTGMLYHATKRFGLSLGDRACLALARLEKLPVLTADRVWTEIDCGVTVTLIR